MSVSTDAVLAFGFDLGEELPKSFITDEEDVEENGFDFETFILDKAELSLPAGEYNSPGVQSYIKAKAEYLAAYPVDLEWHCSYEYPMYFLSIRGTAKRAKRGFPESVRLETIQEEKIESMRRFCEEHDIEWQEPTWHIFSIWG